MPDTPSTTLIHYAAGFKPACGWHEDDVNISANPGEVTCFSCRNNSKFKAAQRGVETPTPLPQRVAPPPLTPPVKLSAVMADSEEMQALAKRAAEMQALAKRAAEHEFKLTDHRNHRNMYSIEEHIHHGEYRSTRTVEVYDINETTVDAVLQSSAYCYGSWKHPENREHFAHRNTALAQLVDDLRHGRVNRSIGWSTFRLV